MDLIFVKEKWKKRNAELSLLSIDVKYRLQHGTFVYLMLTLVQNHASHN